MGFKSYSGTARLGAGLIPASEGYPLMQSCDIQVDEEGTRLDAFLGAIPNIIFKTQEEYDALAEAGNLIKDALYLIIEEDSV